MNDDRFDELTRRFSLDRARERLSQWAAALGLIAGGIGASQLATEARRKKKSKARHDHDKHHDRHAGDVTREGKGGKKKKKKKKTPAPIPPPPFASPPSPPPPCVLTCTGACGAPDGCGGVCQSGSCPAGFVCVGGACQSTCPTTLCGGVCVDPQTDPYHCGRCDAPCLPGQTCVAGTCTGCATGQKPCGPDCIPETNCCGDGDCIGGKSCQAGSCVCPGTKTECGGACVSIETDPDHCGSCDTTCAGGTCIRGACSAAEVCDRIDNDLDGEIDEGDLCPHNKVCRDGVCVCPDGKADCDGDGICEQLGTASHCARCNDACPREMVCHDGACRCPDTTRVCGDRCVPSAECCTDAECGGELVCRSGACGCPGSRKRCGDQCIPDGGCCSDDECPGGRECRSATCVCPGALTDCGDSCVDTGADAAHCGACGTTCRDGLRCRDGACLCGEAKTECSGACVNLDADPDHCGRCDHRCPGGACVAGACADPEVCDRVDNDLDGEVDEGDLCTGGKVCQDGACLCPAGSADCDGDGTCDVLGTSTHCARCHDACPLEMACREGVCRCPESTRPCADRCVQLADCCSDDECGGELVCRGGACGCPGAKKPCGDRCIPDGGCCSSDECSGGRECRDATCTCPAGLVECGDVCVDSSIDRNHCGGCDQTCAGGKRCQSGVCTCGADEIDCDGTCLPVRSCCRDADCSGGKRCHSGTCACAGGAIECDGDCVNPAVDPQHCGDCHTVCTSGTCVGAQCAEPEVCDARDNDLDGAIDEGELCSGGKVCRDGACVCPGGTTDCNGDGTCEILGSDTHCARCNDPCTNGKTCQVGVCACPPGLTECAGVCSEGACAARCTVQAECAALEFCHSSGRCRGKLSLGAFCNHSRPYECQSGICGPDIALCCDVSGECSPPCQSHLDCGAGTHCSASGFCTMLLFQASQCAHDYECESGHCVGIGLERICCDQACTDPCQSCFSGVSAGTCITLGDTATCTTADGLPGSCRQGSCRAMTACEDGSWDCGDGTCQQCCTEDHCRQYFLSHYGETFFGSPCCDTTTSTCQVTCEGGYYSCGGPCVACCEDQHCPDGWFCRDGTCTAPCGPGERFCRQLGACIAEGACCDDDCPSGTHCCADGTCAGCCVDDECRSVYGGIAWKCKDGECICGDTACHSDFCCGGGVCCDAPCCRTATYDPGVCCQGDETCCVGFCFEGDCIEGVRCPAGSILCDHQCHDPLSDPRHCGDCDTLCPRGETCQGGFCGCSGQTCSNTCCGGVCCDQECCGDSCCEGGTYCCGDTCCAGDCCGDVCCERACCGGVCCDSPGHLCCGGSCIDPVGNTEHCGHCDNACPLDATCEDGVCTTCDGVIENGQCKIVDTSSDPKHCGQIGKPCAGRNTVCESGRCICKQHPFAEISSRWRDFYVDCGFDCCPIGNNDPDSDPLQYCDLETKQCKCPDGLVMCVDTCCDPAQCATCTEHFKDKEEFRHDPVPLKESWHYGVCEPLGRNWGDDNKQCVEGHLFCTGTSSGVPTCNYVARLPRWLSGSELDSWDDVIIRTCCPPETGCLSTFPERLIRNKISATYMPFNHNYRDDICCEPGSPHCVVGDPPPGPPPPSGGGGGTSFDLHHVFVGKSFIADPIVVESVEHIDNYQMIALLALLSSAHEDPHDTKTVYEALGYRLFTEMYARMTCNGDGTVREAKFDRPPRFRVGYEDMQSLFEGTAADYITPDIWVEGLLVDCDANFHVGTDATCAAFEAHVGAIPNPFAAYGLCVAGGYRDYRTVRHIVRAKFCCDGTVEATITGTKFPSHRLFVDGVETSTVLQGPLEELLRIDHPDWEPMDNVDFVLWIIPPISDDCSSLVDHVPPHGTCGP